MKLIFILASYLLLSTTAFAHGISESDMQAGYGGRWKPSLYLAWSHTYDNWV